MIDTRAVLERAGVRVDGWKQLFFFHPRLMLTALERSRAGSVQPPLRLVVREENDGGRRVTDVLWTAPEHTFGRYPGMDAFARELGALIDAIVRSVTRRA